jgi:hypothetical protein
VLLPDGRVVLVPCYAKTIGIFDPATNAYSTIAGAPGGGAYQGGVLLPDGRVVFVPYCAQTIGIFNPATNAYSTVTNTPGEFASYGGVLLRDGRVVFVPYGAKRVGILALSDEKARARAQARAEAVKEELVAAAWHPKRMAAWCLDDGERRELAEMGLC